MNPFYLERLFRKLGEPWWFWPLVMSVLFALVVVGSSFT